MPSVKATLLEKPRASDKQDSDTIKIGVCGFSVESSLFVSLFHGISFRFPHITFLPTTKLVQGKRTRNRRKKEQNKKKRRNLSHLSDICIIKFPAYKMTGMKGSTSSAVDIRSLHKEWDEASCPICMDHPHNAVLLLCSSHDKGCRSYICDTSYRHSNCLDRFKKMGADLSSGPTGPTISFVEASGSERPDLLEPLDLQEPLTHNFTSEANPIFGVPRARRNLVEIHEDSNFEVSNEGDSVGLWTVLEEHGREESNGYLEPQRMGTEPDSHAGIGPEESGGGSSWDLNLNLKCPLCRGIVRGIKIVKEAREYLDLKERTCSRESCSFSGNYRELRRHARRLHPTTRPADVDPSRQRAWRHLEHQREYGDIVSAIRAAMPGAIMLGDYVIDDGDRFPSEGNSSLGEGIGPWWTTFFLFHMTDPVDEPRSLSRSWRRHRRSSGTFSGHRHLWGDDLLGLQDDEEEWSVVAVISPPEPINLGAQEGTHLKEGTKPQQERGKQWLRRIVMGIYLCLKH
ncbi:hypothetical protein CKAN_02673500 [Cinnamomum micranthum f. kanehirae]|uniref:DUF1644 domain-containing protein n=1 Tax=Cinnamomum micranthum f. kanehirae TaxID=337451 RepID=A0A443Q2T7_9MAGN|nr:hypothetical protein CKAN_02673500 [Cinnamomum micranthum f. kanehirae]